MLTGALGVSAPTDELSVSDGTLVGGLVPTWHFVDMVPRPSFARVDPLPARLQWIDLDAVEPLAAQSVLTDEQVALIVVLWAAFLFVTHDPRKVDQRLAAPVQWGYSLLHADRALTPAIDEVLQLLAAGLKYLLKLLLNLRSAMSSKVKAKRLLRKPDTSESQAPRTP